MKVLKLILIPLCVILMSASASAQSIADVDAKTNDNKAKAENNAAAQHSIQLRVLALEACMGENCGLGAAVAVLDEEVAAIEATSLMVYGTDKEQWVEKAANLRDDVNKIAPMREDIGVREAGKDPLYTIVNTLVTKIDTLEVAKDIIVDSFAAFKSKLEIRDFRDAVKLLKRVNKFRDNLEEQKKLGEEGYKRIGTTSSSASDTFLTNYNPLEVASIVNMRLGGIFDAMDEVTASKPLEKHDFLIHPEYAGVFNILAYAPIFANDIGWQLYLDKPWRRDLVIAKIKREFHGFGKPLVYSIAFLGGRVIGLYREYGLEPPFAIPEPPLECPTIRCTVQMVMQQPIACQPCLDTVFADCFALYGVEFGDDYVACVEAGVADCMATIDNCSIACAVSICPLTPGGRAALEEEQSNLQMRLNTLSLIAEADLTEEQIAEKLVIAGEIENIRNKLGFTTKHAAY